MHRAELWAHSLFFCLKSRPSTTICGFVLSFERLPHLFASRRYSFNRACGLRPFPGSRLWHRALTNLKKYIMATDLTSTRGTLSIFPLLTHGSWTKPQYDFTCRLDNLDEEVETLIQIILSSKDSGNKGFVIDLLLRFTKNYAQRT